MLPWVLVLVLAAALACAVGKLFLLRRSLGRMAEDLERILTEDTNVLLSLSTRDPYARTLAASLNRQLRVLRAQRRRYESGDRELKEAVMGISHDLRTPLTAICGYLDLLEREDLSPAARRYLALIAGRAEAMKALTEELFRYSVILSASEELALEPVDLRAAVEEALAGLYAALTGRGIVPAVSLPEVPVMRQLDRAAVQRVLGNILSNAVKYSGGDLEVVLREDGEICFSNSAPGLDEVAVGRLFDRFYTVEAAQGSTGLGLAIAKALTERMGGRITAGYAGGRLRITVTFP